MEDKEHEIICLKAEQKIIETRDEERDRNFTLFAKKQIEIWFYSLCGLILTAVVLAWLSKILK